MNNNKEIKTLEIDSDMLEEINRYTRKELSQDELYVFSVVLCDNNVDRDWEVFPEESLNKLKDMFVGTTGIFDHNPTSKNQTARIFRTEIIKDNNRKTEYNGDYVYLKGYAYMIKTESNLDLIKEIEGGIKKEVSVSCSVKNIVCSVCGKNANECNHIKGKEYGKKKCYNILNEPIDAYEWSFVAIPAQRNAGVIKNFNYNKGEKTVKSCDVIKKLEINNEEKSVTLNCDEVEKLNVFISELKEKSSLGEIYKQDLEKEIIKLSFMSDDNINDNVLENILKKLTLEELKELRKSYLERSDKKQIGSVFTIEQEEKTKNIKSNDFKI